MGDLPKGRLELVRPFIKSGVDFGGPMSMKTSKLRNAKVLKVYIALFVCLATKAGHLEIVSDLSSAAFIATLRRFFARRGKCSDMYSDNATNFIGANKELRKSCEIFKREQVHHQLGVFLGEEGVNWHFIPPRAPHFGGIWEAGIKSAKTHLRRVLGDAKLTFEELYTVITQVEACLNSRPLCPLSSDPSDLSVLTPGHFLIGEALTTIPEPSLINVERNRLSHWKLIQQIAQHFWKRWNSEYISQLQQRTKWKTNQAEIKIGDLVILKEENVPPCCWIKGRVIETFPGKDSLVRVVSVKTKVGIFKRPIVKLCRLPMD